METDGNAPTSIQEIPNAAGVPSEDTSNVVETPPVWTSGTPQREAQAPASDNNGDENGAAATQASDEAAAEGANKTPDTPAYQPRYTPEEIQQLAQAADFQPGEIKADFFDELGNFDEAKFGQFMIENNQNIFNQALNAGKARGELTQVENDSWAHVKESFPEIDGNETLSKALRGARIQDLIAGGDGDLNRLATDIVGPIRENRIKAVEDANKTITDAKKLETLTPEGNTPAAPALSLMQQLQSAVAQGDTQRASSLRHAIRKERINANN